MGDGSDPSVIIDDELPPLSPSLSATCASPSIICKLPDPAVYFIVSYLHDWHVAPTPTPHSNHGEYFDDSDDYVAIPSAQEVDALRMEDVKHSDGQRNIQSEPVHRVSSVNSKRLSQAQTPDENDLSYSELDERAAPFPANATFFDARNEMRYRYLLEHEYNSSRACLSFLVHYHDL